METLQAGYGVQLVSGLRSYLRFRLLWNPKGQKNYSKQTVYDAHLNSKKHIKATSKQATSDKPSADPNGSHTISSQRMPHTSSSAKPRVRTSASLTHLAASLLVILAPMLNDSKSNVERRFSLTAREREQELLEQSKPPPTSTHVAGDGALGEDEEEEERIYNPLKLPLGWDGKPIPYWLYKLHGLGVEYRCEICSDQVYMGRFVSSVHPISWPLTSFSRKNFDRHFQVCVSQHVIIHVYRLVLFRNQDTLLACEPLGCLTQNTSMRSLVLKMLFPVSVDYFHEVELSSFILKWLRS
jgi:hypothetical protein